MRRASVIFLGMIALSACASAGATPAVTSTTIDSPVAVAAAVAEVVVPGQVDWPSVPVAEVPWDPPAGQPVAYPPRVVTEQDFVPFATFGPLTLTHPSDRVESIGFHESTNEGARQLEPLDTAAATFTMETRERGTGSRTAADIVIDPDHQVRSPVSGTVVRSGTYVLYCQYSDDFAVIEPDDRPGWEVKILHINHVRVFRGDRVEAGVTVIADGPTILPFSSQVDEDTSAPSWPHVHVEVIDPSIPDIPGNGSGC